MIRAHIIVKPKADVMDPQGQAVRQALGHLGFDSVADVRVGRYLCVELTDTSPNNANETIAQMCEKLLANPVIEDYEIHIEAGGGNHG